LSFFEAERAMGSEIVVVQNSKNGILLQQKSSLWDIIGGLQMSSILAVVCNCYPFANH
jgi:hypothetical protein